MSAEPIAGGEVSATASARAQSLVGRLVLNRYRLEELVAMGGIAAVFRATRVATGQDVAVKVLHPDAEGLPELVARFEREAVAGQHILHPNVAAVHEFDQLDDGSYFLVQEFIQGITLRELIGKGPVKPRLAARIAQQLASALCAAHDLGIVHRDLKPLNVMLVDGPRQEVKLIDFGLAKVPVERLAVADEDSRRSLTQAGVVFGTVAYMAPETALGMRALDKRADLYALGVILYEMLAGKHPFTATEPVALFAQQRNAVPPPIAQRSPGVVVPAALEAVVQRLLQKDPDARFPHARAVIVALEGAISVIDGTAVPEAPRPIANYDASRSHLPIIVAAVLGLALLGLVVWLTS
jgi:eukaryotic-like serine/threonine-protein kinase